mgnify:CR=1 FL=1
MADQFGILGQAFPANTSEATLYTVPAITSTTVGGVLTAPRSVVVITQAVVTSLIISNRSSSDVTYQIRLKEGASFTQSCTTVATDATVTVEGGATTSAIPVGAQMSGTGVPTGASVLSKTDQTKFEMTAVGDGIGSQTSGLTFYADHDKEFLAYDVTIPNNKTHVLSMGLTLAAGNLLKVQTGTASKLAFTAMGIEVT